MSGLMTVLAVALVTWGVLFVYLVRIERRVKDLEKR